MAFQLNDEYGRTIAGQQFDTETGHWSPIPTGQTPASAPATQALTNSWQDGGVVHNPELNPNTPGVVPTPTHRDASGNLIYTGVDNLQHDQNGNTYQGGTVTPKVTVTQAPAQPASTAPQTTQPAPQAAQPTQQPAAQTAPTMPWAPGHTGADVKSLQDMLVSKGFMTAAEQATGPGIFGPKTQAALAKYQMQNGAAAPATTAPDTSGWSSSGQSTYTNQPETPTQPAKSAIQQVIDDYTTAYQSLGLGDIKAQYQKFVQDQTDLTNKQNDEKAAIDNNPWMTQGIKDNTKAQIDKKYEGRQNTLTHQIDLLDSLYKQGQMEVENIVNKAETINMEQQKEAATIAQKKQDAVDALKLQEAKNGKPVTTAVGIESGGTYTSGTLTFNKDMYDQGKQTLDASRGADTWVNPADYLALLHDFVTHGGLQGDFLKLYPIKSYVNPANTWPQIIALGGGTKPKATKVTSTSSGRSI